MERRYRKPLSETLKSLKPFVFSLAPLLLVLLIAEMLVRFVVQPDIMLYNYETSNFNSDSTHMLIPHPTRIWGLSTGVSNAHGARHVVGDNGLRRVEETGAGLKALTIGDSSIFGHGLSDDETLHSQLSKSFLLRGLEVDVYCGGVPGYSTEQSLLLLDEQGWKLEPDLLVIGSLWSDNNYDLFVDKEWLEELRSPVRIFDKYMYWSSLWSLVRRGQVPDNISKEGALPVGWVRSPYPADSGYRRVPIDDYKLNLATMLEEASERNIGVVFLAPSNRYLLSNGLSESTWDSYFEAMRIIAKEWGVPVVDASEVLKKYSIETETAFLDEMHPTGVANSLYATEIIDTIILSGWPSDPMVPSL